MIQQWRLHQFKSVGKDVNLDFGPLTVFAGANSSGKSTVLQSILLLAQTLTSKVADRALVLNGELAKLGTFDDVLHHDASNRQIGLGFRLQVDPEHSTVSSFGAGSASFELFAEGPLDQQEILCDVDLRFAPIESAQLQKSESLQAQLQRADYSGTVGYIASTDPDRNRAFHFSITRRSGHDLDQLASDLGVGAFSRGFNRDALRYEPSTNVVPPTRVNFRRAFEDLEKPEPVGVELEHFLPTNLIVRFNPLPRQAFSLLTRFHDTGLPQVQRQLSDFARAEDPVRRAIANALIRSSNSNPKEAAKHLRKLMVEVFRGEGPELLKEVFSKVIEDATRELGRVISLEPKPLPPLLVHIRNSIMLQLGTRIRYLGPLRDDPKPLYAVAASSDPSSVGVKGEYTAAVLDLYRDKYVDFIPPGEINGTPRRIRLCDAVHAWMKYLDIADSYTTLDEGKLGHRLYIRTGGILRDVDLTNVGVGVSQVLPIVVTAFASEPGACLLFEQPELHLHPKVQSRLADFFLAVIRTGRQCLVETHSEYLINRLRLRIAESEIGSLLHNDIILFFVERRAGESKFRRVEINEFGAIPRWPQGFFDQGPDESDRIMAAAMEKRMRLKRGRE